MANKEENKSLEELQEELKEAKNAYELIKKRTEQKEKEEAERKQAELAAERDKRKKEIEKAEKHYHDLVRQFIKDYGSYSINRSYNDDDDFISLLFGSKPFKLFM